MQLKVKIAGAVTVVALGLGAGVAAFVPQSAGASTTTVGSSEDPQNVTTCAQIGLTGVTQVEGTGDANVTIAAGATGITVSNVGANVVIDAIVVKGGPAYNLTEPGSAGTFSTPNNPNNNTAYGLSHYFLCYHMATPPTTAPPTTAPPTTAPPTTAPPTTAPPTTRPVTPTTRPTTPTTPVTPTVPRVTPPTVVRPTPAPAPAPTVTGAAPRTTG